MVSEIQIVKTLLKLKSLFCKIKDSDNNPKFAFFLFYLKIICFFVLAFVEENMKKLFLFLIFFSIFVLAGCENGSTNNKPDNSTDLQNDEDIISSEADNDPDNDDFDPESTDDDLDSNNDDTDSKSTDDDDKTEADPADEEKCLAREGFAWVASGKACIPKVFGRICTGQTQCFNEESVIYCSSGNYNNKFSGQDAYYAINGMCIPQSFNFEKIDGVNVIKDLNTGLRWKYLSSSEKYTYADAAAYCGESWRIPTLKEFLTTVDDSEFFLAQNRWFLPYPVSFMGSDDTYFWTSTTFAGDDSYKIIWNPIYGDVKHGKITPDGTEKYVMCVGGNELPDSDLTEENKKGDIVYTDKTTELIWQGHIPDTAKSWEEALKYCETLDYAGYTDWRMPNKNELASIINFNKNHSPFSHIPMTLKNNYCWTSTPVPRYIYESDIVTGDSHLVDTIIYIPVVYFETGEIIYIDDFSGGRSVICVRTGKNS